MSLKKRIKRFKAWRRYAADMAAFKRAGGVVTHRWPIITEFEDQAGTASGHYFHQDLLVATLINQAAPRRHIDVGSRTDGFVAHVAAYRDIEVLDVRPLQETRHPRIKFMQANLMQLEPSMAGVCDSLSCLHAIEHFGLGRYGDPIDPEGHLKGFRNFHTMLRPAGTLYISFPIGRNEVHFNAHRVFHPAEIVNWAKGLFDIVRFDYVDDAGDLHCQASIEGLPPLKYGCGIYTLKKIG